MCAHHCQSVLSSPSDVGLKSALTHSRVAGVTSAQAAVSMTTLHQANETNQVETETGEEQPGTASGTCETWSKT